MNDMYFPLLQWVCPDQFSVCYINNMLNIQWIFLIALFKIVKLLFHTFNICYGQGATSIAIGQAGGQVSHY